MKILERKTLSQKIGYYAFLNLGILLMAVGIYFFKAPNNFATGGVSGISIILANMFPVIGQAEYMLIVNILLLIVGIFVLGKECGALTIYCSLMMSLENLFFETFIPLSGPLTNQPILELIYAVLLTGIGSAIIFKCKASSGGTDIVALILKKYTSMNVGTALLYTDFLIAAATFMDFTGDGIAFAPVTGLFSLLGLFAKVYVVDDIIDSINLCKSFTIITSNPEPINEFIHKTIKHGATAYPAEGTYTGEKKTVIMTVCRRSEAIKIRNFAQQVDPHSFIIITKTSEIMGKGFRDNVA